MSHERNMLNVLTKKYTSHIAARAQAGPRCAEYGLQYKVRRATISSSDLRWTCGEKHGRSGVFVKKNCIKVSAGTMA